MGQEVAGDVLKNFAGWQKVHIRPPYGRLGGDKMASCDAAGKWWGAHTSTPRIEGCDQENGGRRYLAVGRSEVFVAAARTMVDYSNKIPTEDGELRQFLCSAEAAGAYVRNFPTRS